MRAAAPTLPVPVNDPFLQAIAERVCATIGRLPYRLEALAEMLGVSVDELHRLDDPDHLLRPVVVIEIVAGLVRQFALDPHWLLTGEYDGAIHRQALLLGEDAGAGGVGLHEYVSEQYRRARERLGYLSISPTDPSAR